MPASSSPTCSKAPASTASLHEKYQLFQYVKGIDNRLFWLNLWLLFFVVIMPFSTALYSYFFGHDNSFIFYTLNLSAIGIMSYWMAVYVIKKENLVKNLGAIQARWMKNRILIGPIVFSFVHPVFVDLTLVGSLWFFPDFRPPDDRR